MTHADRLPPTDTPGVAVDVAELACRGPAAGALEADDARRSITFQPYELAPWRVRVDFLVYHVRDDDSAEQFYEYVVVGYELAKPISILNANAEPDRAAELFPAISARFAANVATYCRQAELLLRQERQEPEEVRQALRSGRAHKYHPLLVAVYRSRSGTPGRIAATAAGFNVHRTTINRELRSACDSGHIDASELEWRQDSRIEKSGTE